MKEHTEENEAFVSLHEKMKAEGHDPQTQAGREAIITACIEQFKIKGKNPRHNYRAWVSRLANAKKYDGRYAQRMKLFQRPLKEKTTTETTTVIAEAAVETDSEVTVSNV